ncbi:hypothetical protein EF919_03325 [Streptomyces sp. WAC02707]|uniref:hypothetical protein n=1 Tax=Streptomyces sp. WAC02707 TaxID=2487417 RepID=UPI000F789F7D|nr:hypothetical protein [Streptomyces sp. WAC02707]RSS97492.1 hypothetical protein EF919_03325 [Streptomyces sp. WAC02707]
MLPCEGEEILCLTLNRFRPPALTIHAPGDGSAYRADFGTTTSRGSAPGQALAPAGAVYPSIPDASADEVVAYYEEHGERLAELVFTAVGAYTGVSINQAAVTAGDLPGLLILRP